jgi:hypothetical protein
MVRRIATAAADHELPQFHPADLALTDHRGSRRAGDRPGPEFVQPSQNIASAADQDVEARLREHEVNPLQAQRLPGEIDPRRRKPRQQRHRRRDVGAPLGGEQTIEELRGSGPDDVAGVEGGVPDLEVGGKSGRSLRRRRSLGMKIQNPGPSVPRRTSRQVRGRSPACQLKEASRPSSLNRTHAEFEPSRGS